MHHKLIAFATAAALIATPALAEDWDFILVNSTGKELKGYELSPAGAGTWAKNKVEEDIKREGNLKNGARTTIRFDKAASQCKYDLKVTFADESSAVWSSINVCDAAYVTLKYVNGTPSFTAS